jgi:hypothetical protein
VNRLTRAELESMSPQQRQLRGAMLRHHVDRLRIEHDRAYHAPARRLALVAS